MRIADPLLESGRPCNLISQAFALFNEGIPLDADEMISYLQQHDEAYCGYCLSEIFNISNEASMDCGLLLRECYHVICSGCIPRHRAQKERCPRCAEGEDQDISISETNLAPESKSTSLSSIPTNQKHYPSKLLALLADIEDRVADKW